MDNWTVFSLVHFSIQEKPPPRPNSDPFKRRPRSRGKGPSGRKRYQEHMKAQGALPHSAESLKQIADLKAAIKAAKPSKYKLNLQTELKKLERDHYHPPHDEL